jgi:uncharacterized protein
MQEVKISIINEFNEKLVGLKTIPDTQKDKYPTVILVHGFGVTKEEYGMFDGIAEHLSQAGILVFRFDFSGCGESEGDYSETSLSKLKSDLTSILKFIKSEQDVDTENIGLLGQSFGTATIVSLELKVQSIVLLGSISEPKSVFISLFGNGYNPEGISERKKSNGTITKIKPQFWQDLENYHLLESIKNIHCPILFIHGEKDNGVPISQMEAYFENANDPKEKFIVKDGDHGLRPNRESVYPIIAKWFKEKLGINLF